LEVLDIILLTHNRLNQTVRCLDALYRCTKVPFKLTIIDDSTDSTPKYIERFKKGHDNINYIRPEEVIRSGNQAINIGLRNTKSEIVLFITQSTYVEPAYLDAALRTIQSEKGVAAIGFKLLYMDGRIMTAGGIVDPQTAVHYAIGSLAPGHLYSQLMEVDVVSFAVVLLRREAIKLDEDFYIGFRGWDDTHNCLEMRERGWHIMYCGLGAAYREIGASSGLTPEAKLEQEENGRRFHERWAGNTKWAETISEEDRIWRKIDYLES